MQQIWQYLEQTQVIQTVENTNPQTAPLNEPVGDIWSDITLEMVCML